MRTLEEIERQRADAVEEVRRAARFHIRECCYAHWRGSCFDFLCEFCGRRVHSSLCSVESMKELAREGCNCWTAKMMRQKENLMDLWFLYGNDGERHTDGNHKFIQRVLEKLEGQEEITVQAFESLGQHCRATKECLDATYKELFEKEKDS